MSDPVMRVLVTTDAVGGVWPYSLDLARGLSPLNVEVVLAILGPPPSAAQKKAASAVPGLRLVQTGLALDWLAEGEEALAEAGRGIARLAEETAADLVQLNMPALAAKVRFPVPVIAVQHSCVATWWDKVRGTELPADFAWRTKLVREGLAAADLVVTPTAAFGEMVRRRYGLKRKPRTVHNGRSPLKLPRHAPHDFVFTAGRLWDDAKGLRTLDAAAAHIAVPVYAAGPQEGPNGASISFDHLNCLGELDETEMGRWLAPRPVFVSAALYEPFGLAVLEAAMAGCPLILSDIPTFREVWGECAVFVPPGDADALVRAIGDLVGDDFERAVLGHAARDRAARYTPEAMAAQMASLYRELLPEVSGPVLAARAAA